MDSKKDTRWKKVFHATVLPVLLSKFTEFNVFSGHEIMFLLQTKITGRKRFKMGSHPFA